MWLRVTRNTHKLVHSYIKVPLYYSPFFPFVKYLTFKHPSCVKVCICYEFVAAFWCYSATGIMTLIIVYNTVYCETSQAYNLAYWAFDQYKYAKVLASHHQSKAHSGSHSCQAITSQILRMLCSPPFFFKVCSSQTSICSLTGVLCCKTSELPSVALWSPLKCKYFCAYGLLKVS